MSESMRGSRLGALSYETDAHVVQAERLAVAYQCPEGHRTVVPYSVEAEEIPYEWTCRCGRTAVRPDVEAPERKPRPEKPVDPDSPFAVLGALKAKLGGK